MITAKCTHPPFVLVVAEQLDPMVCDAISQQIEDAQAQGRPIKAVLARSEHIERVEVIECSWCRNPDAQDDR